jgi:glycosyltransferase involved in cell wall biosynthesis
MLAAALDMNDSLKIALVTGGLQFGGTTTFYLHLASGLRNLGIDTAIFSLSHSNPFATEFAHAGIPVCTCDDRKNIFEDRIATTYKKIAEFQPSAAIANIGAESFEMLSYLPEGVTRLGMIHDLAMQPQRLIPEYKDVLDGVAVVNCHLQKQVQHVAGTIPCAYLAHGIPLPKENMFRPANPTDPLKIIFFGRLAEGKGTRLFPEIISKLHQRKIPFKWTIHGEGPDESFLRKCLENEIKTGEVVLSKQLPRDRLFSLVREHDVFIMASELEGGPLTLLEAMSLGLVPICNDIPCLVQEVINSENGFCIPRAPEKYGECITALHKDRIRLEAMSYSARTTISLDYSVEAMAKRYAEFLTTIASKPSSISWQNCIRPSPVRGAKLITRLTQTIGLFRVARRILKRIKS